MHGSDQYSNDFFRFKWWLLAVSITLPTLAHWLDSTNSYTHRGIANNPIVAYPHEKTTLEKKYTHTTAHPTPVNEENILQKKEPYDLQNNIARLTIGLDYDEVEYLLRSTGDSQGKLGNSELVIESYIFSLADGNNLKAIFHDGKLYSWDWVSTEPQALEEYIVPKNPVQNKAIIQPLNPQKNTPSLPNEEVVEKIRIPSITEFPL